MTEKSVRLNGQLVRPGESVLIHGHNGRQGKYRGECEDGRLMVSLNVSKYSPTQPIENLCQILFEVLRADEHRLADWVIQESGEAH